MTRYLSLLSSIAAAAATIRSAHSFSPPPSSLSSSSRSSSCTPPLHHPIRSKSQSITSSIRTNIPCLQESKTNDQSSLDQKTTIQPSQPSTGLQNKQIMAILSLLGIIETSYLTYDKLSSSSSSLIDSFCSADGAGCNSILNGPYSTITLLDGAVDIPLSVLGLGAYGTVFGMTILPFLFPTTKVQAKDGSTSLLGITTLMATFSVYLVSLIILSLHSSCVFCFVSAGLSISLAALAWLEFGSEEVTISTTDEDDELVVLSKENIVNYRKKGVVTGIASFGVATVLALGLFLSVDDGASSTASYSASSASSANSINSGTLVASTEPIIDMSQNIPPPITTKSSQEALSLANDLSTLNSRMFGAFWCSHCYDQKQSLGLQAMQSIPYVECDKDGYNNQRALCRERGRVFCLIVQCEMMQQLNNRVFAKREYRNQMLAPTLEKGHLVL